MVDYVALAAQMGSHSRPAIKRRFQVLLVDETHQLQVERALACWLIIVRRARQADQLALPSETDFIMTWLNKRPLSLN
jgi:hypothetical protein